MKKLVILGVILLVICLALFLLPNHKLAKKMKDTYSGDQNYVTLTGEIIEADGHNVRIKCKELKGYIDFKVNFATIIFTVKKV